MMAVPIAKVVLLDNIQTGYKQFETMLAPLSEEQMITPNVNGAWSIKDNIAHLTSWQSYVLRQLQGVMTGKEPPEFLPGLSTEDEENEHFYQENKDRPLSEVLAAFRVSYQRVLASVQSMSEETLNAPFPWEEGRIVWTFIAGNTYEHYQEHGNIIERWLA
ncbi:MAG TPA: hypothetical protein DDW33_02320 [Ktedonobacter sp.]|nr:hypothetical protein [Ktedonobacter sp.]